MVPGLISPFLGYSPALVAAPCMDERKLMACFQLAWRPRSYAPLGRGSERKVTWVSLLESDQSKYSEYFNPARYLVVVNDPLRPALPKRLSGMSDFRSLLFLSLAVTSGLVSP